MRVAVASGKGGTGKTTIAVSLALCSPGRTQLLDCDVEEPNAGLFFAQRDARVSAVTVPVPVIDEDRCAGCGACAAFCEFNAIARVGGSALVFPELCHSCGGCSLVCPEGAIHEEPAAIGTLTSSEIRREGGPALEFHKGLLAIGKAMSPPVIRAVKERAAGFPPDGLSVIDAPPGASCPMWAALGGADYAILVAEPTPFGLHDLELAAKAVRTMGIPFGVIINRSDSGDGRVLAYCERESIRLLMQIPDDLRVARGYSEGKPLVVSAPEYRRNFEALAKTLAEGASTFPEARGAGKGAAR
jgi:MinD superfamily P-loop ATPase